jgi:hypothetical protein
MIEDASDREVMDHYAAAAHQQRRGGALDTAEPMQAAETIAPGEVRGSDPCRGPSTWPRPPNVAFSSAALNLSGSCWPGSGPTPPLARRGRGDQLKTAVGNLRAFFSEVPDVEAIARLAGDPHSAAPSSPPLVLEGLLALDLEELELPLPQERLDFRRPWTTWRGG